MDYRFLRVGNEMVLLFFEHCTVAVGLAEEKKHRNLAWKQKVYNQCEWGVWNGRKAQRLCPFHRRSHIFLISHFSCNSIILKCYMFRLDSDGFLKEFLMSLWKHHDLWPEWNYCHVEKWHQLQGFLFGHPTVFSTCRCVQRLNTSKCTFKNLHSLSAQALLRNYL